jgi:hypothetical protein
MSCEELNYEALHPRCSASGSALHDNVAHLSHLIPGAVEDWQAPDA